MKKLILFASGAGSNAEAIVNFLESDENVDIISVFTNNENAGVIQRMDDLGIDVRVFDADELKLGEITQELEFLNPDLIVLAGFLLKIPADMVEKFPRKIVNIHPALLPKYGGKGMYGQRVHQAVFDAKEAESGISIHFIDEQYDQGELLAQFKVDVSDCQSAAEIEQRVRQLELTHYPKVLSELVHQ